MRTVVDYYSVNYSHSSTVPEQVVIEINCSGEVLG